MLSYAEFLDKKRFSIQESGFEAEINKEIDAVLFDYQRDIIKWACRRGKAAIFADTGLGKSLMQLTWADQVAKHTGRKVLIVAPLAVSFQFITEADKFGIQAGKVGSDCMIHVINYEQLHKINANEYAGVALDESSILKGMDGKLRKMITETFKRTAYKLSCTATPSPNDFVELGRYASPIWMDINQTRTLQFTSGRDSDDERHICPLQLDVVERAMQLWSKPGDVIFTPFLGIGSEAYVAVKMGRKAIGAELKPSYFKLASRNLKDAEKSQYDLFGGAS